MRPGLTHAIQEGRPITCRRAGPAGLHPLPDELLSGRHTIEHSKLKQHTGDAAHVFVAKKNNEVVGFCLTLRHKETLDVLTSGFNYDAQTKTDFTYFNLCYYSPIQWAINHGVRKIYFHGTADQAKLFRGCRPEKLYFFVKYHNRPVRVAMNKVFYPLYEGIVLSIFPEALKRKLNH